MPSYTQDKSGKLKLVEQTDNPDQAVEQAKQLHHEQPAPAGPAAAEQEKK